MKNNALEKVSKGLINEMGTHILNFKSKIYYSNISSYLPSHFDLETTIKDVF